MPLPDLSPLCRQIGHASGGLRIPLPGGAELLAQAGIEDGDMAKVARGLLAQANAALTPLVPIFNVIDAVKAVVDCVQAIPDAIGPPPDPTAIARCIPGLVEKLEKILQLLPQYSVPSLVKGIIDALVAVLDGMKAELQAIIRQQARIAASATLAAQPGNYRLQVVVDCATGNIDRQFENLSATMAPLNRLIGIVNILLGLAGQDAIPDLAALGNDAQAALAPIDAAVAVLRAIQSTLAG